MTDNYDEIYRRADVFGSEASPLLEQYADYLTAGGSVLDIGVGQGRNALPLARAGCRVTGIDLSGLAVETVLQSAADEGLVLTAIQAGFENYDEPDLFDAVLCFGLLQIQDPAGAVALLDRCKRWLKPGGTLFLTAWHDGDPSYPKIKDEWEEVSPCCFRSREPEPRVRFFLSPGQILDFFPGWELRHHQECLGPWHSHGDGARERHGDVNLVISKPLYNL